jgi:trimethylamine--corrinoid protein Co-methyltransferase
MATKFDFALAAVHSQENLVGYDGLFPLVSEVQETSQREILTPNVQFYSQQIVPLLEEKRAYQRIHENAQRVLAEIGIDLASSPELMDLLVEADAVDFEASDSVFVPIKREYITRCLDLVPRQLPLDPGRNAFGTGAWPPFLGRPGASADRPATAEEFREIVRLAAGYADVVAIFSAPVKVDRGLTDFGCAQVMEGHFEGLKMIATGRMADHEAAHFAGRPDWLDGVSLLTGLTPMASMVQPFLRSCRAGNQLLLLDLSIAGFTAPHSPEGLLTLAHAHELFMMVVAQTVNPGLTCVHAGLPGVISPETGDLSYSVPSQTLVNVAMARLNQWVTGLPTCQSGGSTSEARDVDLAVEESDFHRNLLRLLGTHIVRHALGAMGTLNYFNVDKFVRDCELERVAQTYGPGESPRPLPLVLPHDETALEGIREMALKGCNARHTDHCLQHLQSFTEWEDQVMPSLRTQLVPAVAPVTELGLEQLTTNPILDPGMLESSLDAADLPRA